MDYLAKIIEQKRLDVASAKRRVQIADLKLRCADLPAAYPFAQSILSRNGIIAEFKRQSPSKGVIHANIEPCDVVPFYEKAGVSAVSVLTDTPFFGGTLHDLVQASQCLGIPVLRKDFIIDEYQIYEARANGASAVLLIAAVLGKNECEHLAGLARAIGLEVLLELHVEEELDRLVDGVTVVGINNRNLQTFGVNLEHSESLAALLPHSLPRISESGINSTNEMIMLRKGGFNGFLIGECFMREHNPGEACVDFCNNYSMLCAHSQE